MTRNAAYKARWRNARFAEQWDEAIATAVDLFEANMHRRAYVGLEEPVYYQGQVVGHVRKYSDNLAMFLMRKHRPEYRESYAVEHSGAVGGAAERTVNVQIELVKADDPLADEGP